MADKLKYLLIVCFSLLITPVVFAQNEAIRSRLSHIPVLCYHQIRDWHSTDSKNARTYIVPPAVFMQEMKALHNQGYYTITPDQLTAYANGKINLPGKPFLLAFDDGTESQLTNAVPVLNAYHYKAVFFIMTVTLGHKNYLSKEQIKQLQKQGHIIECHTWDHHDVRKYNAADWNTQLTKPTQQLEQLTGTRIRYFAYPFGLWNKAAVQQLKAQHYVAAFQLTGKMDPDEPLYTIRRILVDGHWNVPYLLNVLKKQ